MRRPFLLLPLALGLLAFGLSRQVLDIRLPVVTPAAEEGVLNTSEGMVHFTLYRPASARNPRTLLLLAADARATSPRPLRLLAQAAAAAGFASAYLEPTAAPAEAAARLKGLLERHAVALGLDSASVWTWVDGGRLTAPETPPCRHRSLGRQLAALERLGHPLDAPGALLRNALQLLTQSGCSAARHL